MGGCRTLRLTRHHWTHITDLSEDRWKEMTLWSSSTSAWISTEKAFRLSNRFWICLKNQQTVKALLSGYLFIYFFFFFYSSHHSDTVSPRFPLRENIPIPYCNIYICRYVHVSELFHVVSTFISVNSCTLFNSLKQLEQLMYLAVCKWLKGSQIALLYCGDSCKDELYFLGNYIWNLFGIWMWNNEIFASPSLFSSPSVTHPIYNSNISNVLLRVDQQGVLGFTRATSAL